jgi:23S rRNA pseudouridine1911/1915/1917 synthase
MSDDPQENLTDETEADDDGDNEEQVISLQSGDVTSADRIDRWLADQLPDFSRSFLQKCIKDGRVTVDGKAVKSRATIQPNQTVELAVPQLEEAAPEPQKIPLDVLYEDDALLVINKPAGMVVHPSAGHPDGTLVNAILGHCGESLSGINGVRRPGIVHRLDADTSGAILVAKHDQAHRHLAAALKDRSLKRTYWALVQGATKEAEGTIETWLGRSTNNRLRRAVVPEKRGDARHAVTHWRVLERFHGATLIECRLQTGRTHQIRVHLAHLGHPVVGDDLYGFRPEVVEGQQVGRNRFLFHQALQRLKRQFLHAVSLEFVHPTTGETHRVEAPLADDLQALLTTFRDSAGA